MSKAEYWQRGETLDFVNSTGKVIEANTIIVLGQRIGVAGTEIPAGKKGTVHVEGIYSFPKAKSTAITAGALVYWDKTNNCLTTTSTSNILAGYAAEAAGENDATVLVKING